MQMHIFSTPDTGLATALITTGVPLDYMQRDPKDNRVYFHFDREKYPQIDAVIQAFWSQTLSVDASSILSQSKLLKRRMITEAR